MYYWIEINGPADYARLDGLGDNYKAAHIVEVLSQGLTRSSQGYCR